MAGVPFDQLDGDIWYNGEFVEWGNAQVHVLTHGLHYASCVFEGERAYGGKIFKLTEHTERLHKSAEYLGFEIPYSVEEIDAACANKDPNETIIVIREMTPEEQADQHKRNAVASYTLAHQGKDKS